MTRPRPIPIPRGHPWSCATCTVQVWVIAQRGGLTVEKLQPVVGTVRERARERAAS